MTPYQVPSGTSNTDSEAAYRVLLPAGLELGNDRQRFVVGAVTAWQARRIYGAGPNGPYTWVPLANTFLRAHIGKAHIRATLRALRDVLEADLVTYPGKARCYRLRERYRNRPRRAETIRNPDIRAAIDRHRAAREAQLTGLERALKGYVESATVACAVRDGVWSHPYFTVDEYAGRIHHPLTCLPREYRPHVRLGGVSGLVCLDVTSCQPLLIGLSLSVPDLSALSPNTVGSVGLVIDARCCDVREYVEVCLGGGLYEALMAGTGIADREQQKADYMAAVFGAPGYSRRTATGKAMRRLWPGLMRRVEDAHRAHGHEALNRMAQRLEREVMVDGAIGAFVQSHPGVPVLPMHDALVVPSEHRERAEECIASAWRARFGLAPRIKVESWSD